MTIHKYRDTFYDSPFLFYVVQMVKRESWDMEQTKLDILPSHLSPAQVVFAILWNAA